MTTYYLPKAESEYVDSQPKGWLRDLVRREMSPPPAAPKDETPPPPPAFCEHCGVRLQIPGAQTCFHCGGSQT